MSNSELIEPTPEEAKNGWTAEALTRYIRRIEAAESEEYGAERVHSVNPVRVESRYNPLRW